MTEDYFFDVPAIQLENIDGKTILILLKKKDSKIEHIDLVKNILKSLSLTINAVQLEILESNILIGKEMASYEKIICFGINPPEVSINVNFKPYTIHTLSGTKILFAHSLSDMVANAEYKKILWKSLQLMFDFTKQS